MRRTRLDAHRLGRLLGFTVPLRMRGHRHIEHLLHLQRDGAQLSCAPACSSRWRPLAALAAGAAESSRLATGAPEGLKAHTIALATEHGSGSAAHAMAVLSRAGTFGSHGFPRGSAPRSGRRRCTAIRLAVLAVGQAEVAASRCPRGWRRGGQLRAHQRPGPGRACRRPQALRVPSAGAASATSAGWATTVPATTRTAPSTVATFTAVADGPGDHAGLRRSCRRASGSGAGSTPSSSSVPGTARDDEPAGHAFGLALG